MRSARSTSSPTPARRQRGRVLIVEDDPRTAALLELYLRDNGFLAQVEHDGRQGLRAALRGEADLVILDLMLPGCDGWTICRQLRRQSDVPILILSARQEEEDRLVGLGLGADDYVVKPFSPREVVLRVRAILRRTERVIPAARQQETAGSESGQPICIDRQRRCAIAYGRRVPLTPSEFRLLAAFTESPRRTFDRQELLDRLYPAGGSVVPKVIDVHVAKLRQKVEPEARRPRHIVR
jgi:DNA-binding response OmpR family regulator